MPFYHDPNKFEKRLSWDRPADDSVAWSDRRTEEGLLEVLGNYGLKAKGIFADRRYNEHTTGILFKDSYATAQAIKFGNDYRIEFTGHNRLDFTSASLIEIIEGQITVTTNGESTKYSHDPGSDEPTLIYLTDTDTHIIEATKDTKIIQVVSRTRAFGRTLLFPEQEPTKPVKEKFSPRKDRLLASWHFISRIQERAITVANGLASTAKKAVSQAPHIPSQLRRMEFHAHPDDDGSKGAGTRARYAKRCFGHEGVIGVIVFGTRGERGSVLNPAQENPWLPDDDGIAVIREREARAAANENGHSVEFLDYVDSGMGQHRPDEKALANNVVNDAAARDLAVLIRKYRPHVFDAYGPYNAQEYFEKGGYAHLDHDAVHRITPRAIELAADPNAKLDTNHPPWLVPEINEHVPWNWETARWAHRYLVINDTSSPYESIFTESRFPVRFPRVRTDVSHTSHHELLNGYSSPLDIRIRTARHTKQARDAAAKYRTQIGAFVPFQRLPYELFRPVGFRIPIRKRWKRRKRRSDLFAGIRELHSRVFKRQENLYCLLGLSEPTKGFKPTQAAIDAAVISQLQNHLDDEGKLPDEKREEVLQIQHAGDILRDDGDREIYNKYLAAKGRKQLKLAC